MPGRLTAALLLFAACAWTQSPLANWTNLNTLAPGAEVRVSLGDGKAIRGFFQHATPESIALNAARSQETFARADVRRVQARKESHRGRNTLIGMAIGGGAGLALGAVADTKENDFGPTGKFVVGSFGAAVGTVIGVAIPTGGWRDVYRVR